MLFGKDRAQFDQSALSQGDAVIRIDPTCDGRGSEARWGFGTDRIRCKAASDTGTWRQQAESLTALKCGSIGSGASCRAVSKPASRGFISGGYAANLPDLSVRPVKTTSCPREAVLVSYQAQNALALASAGSGRVLPRAP